jgi:hypothetical protein
MTAEITHTEDKIFFKFKNATKLGITDYTDELLKKIKAESWHVSGDYIKCSRLKMSLHHFVMTHWYGEEKLTEAKKNGYIVEHHNNDGFDCRISNLSFAPELLNKAKAFTYDKMRVEMIENIAINFYKDFETGRYQITIGFNKPYYVVNPKQNTAIDVTDIYLLYNGDFYRTMMDATNILHEIKEYGQLKFSNLRYDDFYYKEAIHIPADVPEEQLTFVDDEGRVTVRLGTPHLIINQIGEDKDLYKKKDS